MDYKVDDVVEVNSFVEFHEVISANRFRNCIFRGVRDAKKHLLIPSIGRKSRKQRKRSGFLSYERRIFTLFKEQAIAYIARLPRNELEWLALAQHHGLPTRLLDWTYNPLVAAYFAVEKQHEGDSAIFVYRKIQTIDTTSNIDPFEVKKVYKFRPPHFNERIKAQRSVFTIQPNPRKELLDPERISKIIISEKTRRNIKQTLYWYNISPASLFSGLDGLAKEIVEQHEEM